MNRTTSNLYCQNKDGKQGDQDRYPNHINPSQNVNYDQKFRLEKALGRIQTYYYKYQKYIADSEEDSEDALVE